MPETRRLSPHHPGPVCIPPNWSLWAGDDMRAPVFAGDLAVALSPKPPDIIVPGHEVRDPSNNLGYEGLSRVPPRRSSIKWPIFFISCQACHDGDYSIQKRYQNCNVLGIVDCLTIDPCHASAVSVFGDHLSIPITPGVFDISPARRSPSTDGQRFVASRNRSKPLSIYLWKRLVSLFLVQ